MDSLEALAVDDRWARLVVLLLGDPHLLEGGERCKDRSADPDGVLALWRSDDLDLHGGRGKGDHLLLEALCEALVHGGSTRHDDVSVQVLADINIALHDGLEHGLVDARGFLADEGRLEENLWAAEALVSDGDDVAVRKFVRLLEGGRLCSSLHLLVEVKGDVCKLLLDVADDFALSSGGERVAALGEDLHHVVGEIASGKIDTEDRVRESVSFVDRDGVGDTITRVEDSAGGTARSVQGEDSLDVDVHGRDVEGLEHDLGHALAVSLRVERSLGEEDRVLLRSDAELVVEGVVPDLLHVVPVGHDAVGDGVLQLEHTALGLGLVTDVRLLGVHANHGALLLGHAHDGREHRAGGVITSVAGLHHAAAIVDNQRRATLLRRLRARHV
mmetsp:Transcript_16069/g.22656  ORF Transcript_16069/g.22656 Transcript_16069/m.22656 type:complete len:387 (-) Transcript_16069:93-1253(-)